jgi:AICAR transformylase/IMP cyclohydrolase PurH
MTTKNALISVYNKDGIIPFVEGLKKLGYTLYSSGGTANKIKEAGIEVHDVAELVGGGAILGHKVVTLSREISAGILADPTNEKEMKEMETLGLPIIDLVCVDCYPLAEALTMADVKREFVLEKTDIGGPTMLRAAAKGRRIVLCDVADRPKVIEWLEAGKPDEDKFIAALVAKAEMYVANYALMSARYHGEGTYYGMMGEKIDQPRYGENPWQKSLGLFKAFGENTDPLSIDKFKVIVGNPGRPDLTNNHPHCCCSLQKSTVSNEKLFRSRRQTWQSLWSCYRRYAKGHVGKYAGWESAQYFRWCSDNRFCYHRRACRGFEKLSLFNQTIVGYDYCTKCHS